MSDPVAVLSLPVVRGSDLDGSRCPPAHLTEGNRPADLRPFIEGCYLLGLEPKPQQLVLARVVLSGVRRAAVCVPRRAGKTTALWAVVLGLCLTRDGYTVHFTAQSGLKARARWSDVVRLLETPAAKARLDRLGVSLTVHRSQGSEALTFGNGSRVLVMPPKGESFRGEESDLWWLDEAQELDAAESLELTEAVAPTQDTRPGALMLVSGTAGAAREGVLWRWLVDGRDHRPGNGVVEYAADPTLDADDPETWAAAHPGLAYGMTTLDVVADRHSSIERADDPTAAAVGFGREYLGRWPVVTGSRLIDPTAWRDLGALDFPDRPADGTGLVFALDCDTHQRWASVVACWRLPDEGPWALELIRQDDGIGWVTRELFDLGRKYPKAVMSWDAMPANLAATEGLARVNPRPKVQPLSFVDMKTAAAAILLAVSEGTVQHYHQAGLDDAVESATPRAIGDGFLFQRGGADVTPLVAASVALLVASRKRVRQRVRARVASSRDAAATA